MAAHLDRSPTTISRLAAGSGDAIPRLQRGHDITYRRHARILQWFSDHWPLDLEWPADIPRPTPTAPEPDDTTDPAALNDDGQIANPNALCASIGVPRHIYDQVVYHYADGRPGQTKWPRVLKSGAYSPTEAVLMALIKADDVRFASRPRLPATMAAALAV